MFERLIALAGRRCAARAAVRRGEIAARIAAAVPDGVSVSEEESGVVLSGRGLGRRMVEDARLRWIGREAAR